MWNNEVLGVGGPDYLDESYLQQCHKQLPILGRAVCGIMKFLALAGRSIG